MADDTPVDRARKLYRTAEMSASIMRDPRRTGFWSGAERTANAFDRLAGQAKLLHDALNRDQHDGEDLRRAVSKAASISYRYDGQHQLVLRYDSLYVWGQADMAACAVAGPVRDTTAPAPPKAAADALLHLQGLPVGHVMMRADQDAIHALAQAVHDPA